MELPRKGGVVRVHAAGLGKAVPSPAGKPEEAVRNKTPTLNLSFPLSYLGFTRFIGNLSQEGTPLLLEL